MDIESLYTADRHNDGSEMRVIDELGIETDLYIKLVGQDSDIWTNIARRNQHKAIRRMMSKDEDENANENIEMIIEATLGWRGVDLEFSKEAALVLYQKAPYVVDQAILFIANRVNFIKS